MKLEVQVPDTSVYYDLFNYLGLKPDSPKDYFSDYKFFTIDVRTKFFGGNSVSHIRHQKCSIQEAIEFCVTGKLPEPKLYTFDELKPGDKCISIDPYGGCIDTIFEKMETKHPKTQKIVKCEDGKYSIVTCNEWFETKCLRKVGE